jgi:hypothetical protein
MEDAIAGETSTMLEAYREQTEGINKVGHSFEQTRQRMMGLAVRIGDRLLPIAERFMNMIEPWVRRFEKMDDATLKFTMKMAGLAAAIGPAMLIISKMSVGAGTLLQFLGGIGPSASTAAGELAKVGETAGGLKSAAGGIRGIATAIGGVTAALGVGLGIGTMIQKGIIEPFDQMKREQFEAGQEKRYKGEEVLKYGTLKEKESQIKVQEQALKGTDTGTKET